MHAEDAPPPLEAAPTVERVKIPVRRAIPCCVRQAQRPAPDLATHLRAAAVWAALLRPPEPVDDHEVEG